MAEEVDKAGVVAEEVPWINRQVAVVVVATSLGLALLPVLGARPLLKCSGPVVAEAEEASTLV